MKRLKNLNNDLKIQEHLTTILLRPKILGNKNIVILTIIIELHPKLNVGASFKENLNKSLLDYKKTSGMSAIKQEDAN